MVYFIRFPGWRTLLWASLLPVIVSNFLFAHISVEMYTNKPLNWLQIILAVGTKLQATLTRMALEITERHAVVQGMPLIQGSDKYFWFGRPQLVLYLIHFALFQVNNGCPLNSLVLITHLEANEHHFLNKHYFGDLQIAADDVLCCIDFVF